MRDYVVKKEFGRKPGAIRRYLGTGKHELEWHERSYARKFTLEEAQSLANQHLGEVERA